MKKFNVFHWLFAPALAIPMLLLAESAVGHGSGGGHGTGGGGHGTGSGGHGASSGSGTSGSQGTAAGHGAATGQAKGANQALLAHRSSLETGDMRFSHEDSHFHHHLRFSTGGPSNLWYRSEYGSYDYRLWPDLAMKVQSGLARRGYYRGPIDGVIGSGSRQAIREFQEKEGLPVTGLIGPDVLRALKLPIPQVSPRFS